MRVTSGSQREPTLTRREPGFGGRFHRNPAGHPPGEAGSLFRPGVTRSVEQRAMTGAIVGLDHVQVAAPAGCEDDARRFYGALLGLEEIEKPPLLAARGGVWFRVGATGTARRRRSRLRPGDEGASGAPRLRRHAALERLAERLEERGIDDHVGRTGGDPRRRALLRRRPVGQPHRARRLTSPPVPRVLISPHTKREENRGAVVDGRRQDDVRSLVLVRRIAQRGVSRRLHSRAQRCSPCSCQPARHASRPSPRTRRSRRSPGRRRRDRRSRRRRGRGRRPDVVRVPVGAMPVVRWCVRTGRTAPSIGGASTTAYVVVVGGRRLAPSGAGNGVERRRLRDGGVERHGARHRSGRAAEHRSRRRSAARPWSARR